ncbi:MAG: DHH family phosphoesterase [Oscillospiraceae bacterium]|jgi:phosphoesterase RecJ-like protein|nr:DHH family phosphoesterase [Oscillospiraceae bacterium]
MTTEECADLLRARDRFLILTHKRPDGDTLGCAAALARGLRMLGKTAFVLENPEAAPRYLPLVLDFYAPEGYVPDCVAAVDVASVSLLPENAAAYAERIDLAIDHHPSNTGYARHTLVDPDCAACGELILDLLAALGITPDSELAAALYVAVSTDTGCFSFNNTTARTFRAAAILAERGADVAEINRILFRTRSRARIAMEGLVYTNMHFLCNGRAAAVVITRQMMEDTGADEDDLDNIAAVPVSIEGVELGITIREIIPRAADDLVRECKVSVRSGLTVSAGTFAARFGGGGHAAAAGFSRSEPSDAVYASVLTALAETFGTAP